MPDETTAALQEIAALLRRRVEQQVEAAERATQIDTPLQDRAKLLEQHRATSEQHFRQIEHDRKEKERFQEEDKQFKQRLLTELERHNSLLERLLSRLP